MTALAEIRFSRRTLLLVLLALAFFVAYVLVVDLLREKERGVMARLVPVDFADLPGWGEDAQEQALAALLRGCPKTVNDPLRAACERAGQLGTNPGRAAARRFFETEFRPYRIDPGKGKRGFLTGYFEPEVRGSRTRSDEFAVPLFGRPDDLVTVDGSQVGGDRPAELAAARRTANGLVPYPTRGEIEQGALAGRGLELVYLADPVEAFFVHVQGSVRVRLDDGTVMRLGFAGKNGHPYTSIGKVLVDEGAMTREEMIADSLRAWLVAHPERAGEVMRQNRSFIFFRELPDIDPALGPPGAQGVSLTALRSLAVDAAYHAYGTPMWIDAELPDGQGGPASFRRLLIAQDTGSAITGPARGDIFFGSGDAAGARAGRIRHAGDFYVLLPRDAPLPAWAAASEASQ